MYLNELELMTEGNIDDKNYRFLRRLCGDYNATTSLHNPIYTRARREKKLIDLTGELQLSLKAKCEIYKLQQDSVTKQLNLSQEISGVHPLAASSLEQMSFTTCHSNMPVSNSGMVASIASAVRQNS